MEIVFDKKRLLPLLRDFHTIGFYGLDIQRYLKVVMLIDALFEHQLHKRRHGYAI